MKKLLRTALIATVVSAILLASAFSASAAEFPRMRRGDLLTELPEATTDKTVTIGDLSRVEHGEFTLSWEPYEGAASYSVRVLFNINYMSGDKGLNFIYEEEFKTDKTEARVEGLEYLRRYTILVYALDSEGKDIALYDREHIFTFPVTEWDNIESELDDPMINNEGLHGLTTQQIIIIIAAVFGVLVIGVVIFAVIMLKKPRKQ